MGKQTGNNERDVEAEPLHEFKIKELANAFAYLDKAMAVFESQDPNAECFGKVTRAIEDSVACYRQIYEEKKYSAKQYSILQFFNHTDRPSCTPTPTSASPHPSRTPTPSPASPASPTSSVDYPDEVPIPALPSSPFQDSSLDSHDETDDVEVNTPPQ